MGKERKEITKRGKFYQFRGKNEGGSLNKMLGRMNNPERNVV